MSYSSSDHEAVTSEETPSSRSVMDYHSVTSLRIALQGCTNTGPMCAGKHQGSGNCVSPCEPSADLDWVMDNLDMETSCAQNINEETSRLQTLKSYGILESEREKSYERITALASRIFDVPIALVSFVDMGRQWFKSNRGLGDVRETPRDVAFCAHAILSTQDLLIVPDATKDFRFATNGLVTGPPHIRFYAGAPLISPEGHKLGTLCIIDSKVRPGGMTLEEKQNLRELAALVMDSMEQRRQDRIRLAEEKSKLIACTAHDLLTPLCGVQLSLSLLLEDEYLRSVLDENQKELIQTAGSCSDVMSRICHQAIENFRGDVVRNEERNSKLRKVVGGEAKETGNGGYIVVFSLVDNLRKVMELYPKHVPLIIDVDPAVPYSIISDDLKIFRSALNYLTNACKKTVTGSISLHIYVLPKGIRGLGPASIDDTTDGKEHSRKVAKGAAKSGDMLMIECVDTGTGVEVEKYSNLFMPFRDPTFDHDAEENHSKMSNSGLGLFSVANNISSLGGEYGYRPRDEKRGIEANAAQGSIFWFSVPLVVPRSEEGVKNKTTTEDGASCETPAIVTGQESKTEEKEVNMVETNPAIAIQPEQNLCNPAPRKRTISDFSDNITNEKLVLPVEDKEIEAGKKMIESGGEGGEKATTVQPQVRVKRALVIDDSISIRKSINRALTKLGFAVSLAENGMEGLQELQSTLFDVALCDFLMPVMDGLDCVQQYREWESIHRNWFRQFIIGISAHASSKDVERGISIGMNCFMTKPVSLKSLKGLPDRSEVRAVSAALDKKFESDNMQVYDEIPEIVSNVRQQEQNLSKPPSSNSDYSVPVCLVADDSKTVAKLLVRVIESRGWKVSMVHNGEDALRLLKMRNWDAVFLDDQMPCLTGMRCVDRFRKWEAQNRVARQNNILLLSANYLASRDADAGLKGSVKYPPGFDGAMGKPVKAEEVSRWLDLASNSGSENDILVR
mmetsp:Transcript_23736/g.34605  ORF Transcript_23736/g.34605 Transcript_23736/m.34605 type:complete len:962 (-) Transcript_23736:631-3516(-)